VQLNSNLWSFTFNQLKFKYAFVLVASVLAIVALEL
jgi:hypothetical protein